MAAPATNVTEYKVHIVRPKYSEELGEADLDAFIDSLSNSDDFTKELSSARQWLAEKLPESLSQLRLSLGMSQSQLAKAVGLRQPNISAIESGKRKPEYDTARKIADVLKITTDDFYAIFDKSA